MSASAVSYDRSVGSARRASTNLDTEVSESVHARNVPLIPVRGFVTRFDCGSLAATTLKLIVHRHLPATGATGAILGICDGHLLPE